MAHVFRPMIYGRCFIAITFMFQDEFVILAGDEGHDMYIVLRGLVNMYNYQGLLLAHISEVPSPI